MKKTAFLPPCLILILALLWPMAAPAATVGPGFTWSAFQRFWDKTATPLVQISNAVRVGDGYLVDYGYTTTLRVLMKGNVVTGVSIRFVGGKENDAGGPQFLRLIYQAITAGTFRWPEDKIQEAREFYAIMSPAPKDFQYMMTRFQRRYAGGQGWEFRFDYVPEDREVQGALLP